MNRGSEEGLSRWVRNCCESNISADLRFVGSLNCFRDRRGLKCEIVDVRCSLVNSSADESGIIRSEGNLFSVAVFHFLVSWAHCYFAVGNWEISRQNFAKSGESELFAHCLLSPQHSEMEKPEKKSLWQTSKLKDSYFVPNAVNNWISVWKRKYGTSSGWIYDWIRRSGWFFPCHSIGCRAAAATLEITDSFLFIRKLCLQSLIGASSGTNGAPRHKKSTFGAHRESNIEHETAKHETLLFRTMETKSFVICLLYLNECWWMRMRAFLSVLKTTFQQEKSGDNH